MSTKEEHVEPSGFLDVAMGDTLSYLPLLLKIVQAFTTGTGTFSTSTPRGKRWVRVQDKPFDTP